MNWLARLKKIENAPAPTLQNLQKEVSGAFVGFVGIPPAPFENSWGDEVDLAGTFPSPANDATADTFTARLGLFTDRGLNLDEAEAMAHRLAFRDGEQDDRRLCLECLHLSGTTEARRCSQWRKLGIHSAAIPADLAVILQRCDEFKKGG